MTQEYKHPLARERMANGLCPECGGTPDGHAPFREFWLRPPGCDLLPAGVTERVEHYQANCCRSGHTDCTVDCGWCKGSGYQARTISLEDAAKELGIDLDTIEPVDIRPFQQ